MGPCEWSESCHDKHSASAIGFGWPWRDDTAVCGQVAFDMIPLEKATCFMAGVRVSVKVKVKVKG